jgi:uncharacterized protein
MFVEKELFVIPEGDNFVLHVPLKRLAVLVTSGVINDLQKCESSGVYPEGPVKDLLLKTGIISENTILPKFLDTVNSEEFRPTDVTLFPTSDCGLRCVYCYASAGVTPKVMDFSVAKAAIDLIIKNAIALRKKSVGISFHGGGEPLYGASELVVRNVVAYANNVTDTSELKVSFSCATNGVLSKRQLNWATKNINRLNLSVDGPPDIQDVQRPLKNGRGSSRFVEHTLAYLEKHKINYGVRATITKLSVGRFTEIVEYIHRIAPSASIHFEPLFSCGRCATTGVEAPDPEIFLREFLAARAYAKTLGVELYNSGASIDRCSEYFCGATRGNFCVTPWGDVTSCFEVSLPSDERSQIFFFGAFNQSSQSFIFDEERLTQLYKRRVSNIPACGDCFMKYACSGDCPAKSVTMMGSLIGGFRCDENRILGLSSIVDRIKPINEFDLRKERNNYVK